MVTSIYIQSYYEWLSSLYLEQGIEFDKTLFYVPGHTPTSMIDYLVRNELVRRDKDSGDQVAYMGFDKSVINTQAGTRPNTAVRMRLDNSEATSRGTRKIQFTLFTYIVTNKPNLAEDIEEIYSTYIKHRSVFSADMKTIFEQDYPEFRINVIHSGIIDSTPMNEKGNLWGMSSTAGIIAPAFTLTQDQMAKARSISVSIYSNNTMKSKTIATK